MNVTVVGVSHQFRLITMTTYRATEMMVTLGRTGTGNVKDIRDRPRNFDLGQERTTPHLIPPLLTSTPHHWEDLSFNRLKVLWLPLHSGSSMTPGLEPAVLLL
ncbi:hypothetical protein TNCV_1799581 [Trichonephila clavipes]|nr:hypothetical protein TNCV_1799581 [Trichonephila clavipes]